MDARRILVTGAAGGVGRVSCDGLRQRGWQVAGFDRSDDPGCCDTWHQGDLTDATALHRAMEGCAAVLHLAANPSTGADFLTQLVEPNIVGVWRVLETALELGIERVILASSINTANGRSGEVLDAVGTQVVDPGNPYGLTKVFAEDAAAFFHHRHGLRSLCARIGTFPRSSSSGRSLEQRGGPELDHYLSHADWLRFLECALAADYGHGVAYAISRPRAERWDYDPAAGRALIGYAPRDRWPEGLPDWIFSQEASTRAGRPHDAAWSPRGAWRGDPRRVLVTGAAGAIGRHLGPALRAAGYTVVGCDRAEDPGGYDAYHRHELTDRAAFDAALEGCAALVHLAAASRSGTPFDQLLEPNVRGLWTALEAAHAAGTPRVVLASSVNACNGPRARAAAPVGTGLADPGNPYGLTKVLAERAGRLFHRHTGMPVVALRLGWFPRDADEVERIAGGGHGAQAAYLSWDDCVGWIRAALEHPDPGYVLAYALSAPPPDPRWDLASSIHDLGYTPRDRWPEGMPAALREVALRATSPA